VHDLNHHAQLASLYQNINQPTNEIVHSDVRFVVVDRSAPHFLCYLIEATPTPQNSRARPAA
jgi:hypothetical protein